MGRITFLLFSIVLVIGLVGASARAEALPPASPMPLQTAAEPEPLYASCRPGEANRESDLCAQWYAADSAFEASVWTRRAAIATVLGLLVGAVTMVAAIGAALFAREAARQAGRSANISQEALNAAEAPHLVPSMSWVNWETFFNELRPFADGDPEPRPINFRVRVELSNYGRSPATIESVDCFAPGASARLQKAMLHTLRPGDAAHFLDEVRGAVTMTRANRKEVKRAPPAIQGTVRYRTTLGQLREMGFAFYSPGWQGLDWGRIAQPELNYDRPVT